MLDCVSKCTNLTKLYLCETSISNIFIYGLTHLTKLTILKLDRCNVIRSDAVHKLVESLPLLELISMENCENISQEEQR